MLEPPGIVPVVTTVFYSVGTEVCATGIIQDSSGIQAALVSFAFRELWQQLLPPKTKTQSITAAPDRNEASKGRAPRAL